MANSLLRSGLLGQTQDEAASLASQPSIPSPEVSKPLTQKHFNAIPQKTKPRALCLVFCARLCLLHTSHRVQGQGTKSSSSSMVCSKRGDEVADLHHTSASATGGRDPGQETCHHTTWLSQPQVSLDRRPALLGGETIRVGFEHTSLCCFSLVCKGRGPAGHPKASCWKLQ